MKKNYLYALLAVAIIMLLLPFLSITTMVSHADEPPLGGTITITAMNGNEAVEEERSEDFEDGIVHVYKWRNVRGLLLHYYSDPENLPPPTATGELKYSFTVSIEYLQGYLNGNFALNHDTMGEAKGPTALQSQTDKEFLFDIDGGIQETIVKASGETKVGKISGWGIYRFKLSVNGREKYTDYYFIEPDDNVTDAPVVKATVVNSENSMHNSYKMSLENYDTFRYIDERYLTWYVMGESKDGTIYALTKTDRDNNPEFAECTDYLYVDIERTGLEFLFNDNEISGKWNIWCVYTNKSTNATFESENRMEVETGKDFNVVALLWVAGALTIVASGVVITLAVLRTKKDKVW